MYKKNDLVEAVKMHARNNYEGSEGWDYVIECFEDAEILEIIGETHSKEEAIARVREHLRPLADRRRDIESEIF